MQFNLKHFSWYWNLLEQGAGRAKVGFPSDCVYKFWIRNSKGKKSALFNTAAKIVKDINFLWNDVIIKGLEGKESRSNYTENTVDWCRIPVLFVKMLTECKQYNKSLLELTYVKVL